MASTIEGCLESVEEDENEPTPTLPTFLYRATSMPVFHHCHIRGDCATTASQMLHAPLANDDGTHGGTAVGSSRSQIYGNGYMH